MKAILLPIHSEHAQNIYSGKKLYEYRTRRPAQEVGCILLYETGGVGAITGAALTDKVLEGSPDEIWEITKSRAGISRDYFHGYFSGRNKAYAYAISEAIPFAESLSLNDFGIQRAPQSFQYIDWLDAKRAIDEHSTTL